MYAVDKVLKHSYFIKCFYSRWVCLMKAVRYAYRHVGCDRWQLGLFNFLVSFCSRGTVQSIKYSRGTVPFFLYLTLSLTLVFSPPPSFTHTLPSLYLILSTTFSPLCGGTTQSITNLVFVFILQLLFVHALYCGLPL